MPPPEPQNPASLDPRAYGDTTANPSVGVLNRAPAPTFPPYPTTGAEAGTSISQLQAQKGPTLKALNDYRTAHPEIKESGGQMVRQVLVGTSLDDLGNEVPQYKTEVDPQGTQLLQNANSIDDMIKQIQADQKAKLIGPTNTAMSYVDSEQMKQDEAKKEFVDAMTRIKALYDFNEQQQAASLNNQKANAQRKEDVFSGAPGGLIRPLYDPRQAQLSQMMRGALPSSIPPYYSMSEAVGLPGKEGLGGGISYTPQDYGSALSGYAAGTGNGPGGIDPEIAWMIGKPDVPVVLDPSKVPPLPPTAPSQMRGKR